MWWVTSLVEYEKVVGGVEVAMLVAYHKGTSIFLNRITGKKNWSHL